MDTHGIKKYFDLISWIDGKEIGARFAKPEDAESLIEVFRDVYQWEYLDPCVYDKNWYKEALSKETNLMLIGELIETSEIIGTVMVEKVNEYTAHSSKGLLKKKYQGQGLSREIAPRAFLYMISRPAFKSILRIVVYVLPLWIYALEQT